MRYTILFALAFSTILPSCTTETVDGCNPGFDAEGDICVPDCVDERGELEAIGMLDELCPPLDMGTDMTVDADAGPDMASACTETCAGATPLCNEDTGECVQCLSPTDCNAIPSRPMCVAGSCVQCTASTECTEATASVCADEGDDANTCVACAAAGDCDGIMDGDTSLSFCDTSGDAGECVQCTEASAADQCGDNSCDPATNRCTTTERGTVDRCEPCTGDDECQDGLGCIAIDELGGTNAYCMPLLPESGICPNVFRTVLEDVVSLSNADAASYCTFDLATFSCEGILSLSDACEAEEPRCPGGAQCETIPGSGEVCTLSCSTPVECPDAGPFSGCGGAGYCGS